ncbi:MAG: hypothetical protein DRP62_07385, partial [Planctomycetota bacterium]
MKKDYSLAQNLLKEAISRSEAAEVVFSSGQTRGVSFEHSKLKIVGAKYSVQVGLRLIKNGRIGVAATNNLDRTGDLVSKALAVSEFGPAALFEFPALTKYQEVKVFDPAVEKIPEEKFVNLGQRIVDDFYKFNPNAL